MTIQLDDLPEIYEQSIKNYHMLMSRRVKDILVVTSLYDACIINQDQRLEADIAFHSAILKASHNEVLTHFPYAIAAYLKAHSRLGQQVSPADDAEDLARHHRIAMAIATGKAKSAYNLTVEMLQSNRSHFEQED